MPALNALKVSLETYYLPSSSALIASSIYSLFLNFFGISYYRSKFLPLSTAYLSFRFSFYKRYQNFSKGFYLSLKYLRDSWLIISTVSLLSTKIFLRLFSSIVIVGSLKKNDNKKLLDF